MAAACELDNTLHLHISHIPCPLIIKHCIIELLSVYTVGLLLLLWLCRWGWDVNKAGVLLVWDGVFILGVSRALIEDWWIYINFLLTPASFICSQIAQERWVCWPACQPFSYEQWAEPSAWLSSTYTTTQHTIIQCSWWHSSKCTWETVKSSTFGMPNKKK